jgi:hypothetical protein
LDTWQPIFPFPYSYLFEKEYEIRNRGYEYTESMMPAKMAKLIFKNIMKKTEWQN